MVFLVSGFVLFLPGRSQLCFNSFSKREGERERVSFFFFGPKWILWCEKVGITCADKADTKATRSQLSFPPSPSSLLSLSRTLYRFSFSGTIAAPRTTS